MNLGEKLNYAGERLIRQYGCFGCHEIPGFETAKPIGTELTAIGHKPLHQFDFGFLHIEHTRYDWWTQKMKDPRSFDEHKELEPDLLLRMPNYGFTDQQVEAVVTVLAGFVEPDEDLTKIVPRTPERLAIERGQQLVRTNNCQACHIIEGEGGSIAPTVTDWLVRFRNQGAAAAEAATRRLRAAQPGRRRRQGADRLAVRVPAPAVGDPPMAGRAHAPRSASARARSTTWRATSAPSTGRSSRSWSGWSRRSPAEELQAAEKLWSTDYFNCTTCHIQGGETPPGTPDRWAPDFALAADRLKPPVDHRLDRRSADAAARHQDADLLSAGHASRHPGRRRRSPDPGAARLHPDHRPGSSRELGAGGAHAASPVRLRLPCRSAACTRCGCGSTAATGSTTASRASTWAWRRSCWAWACCWSPWSRGRAPRAAAWRGRGWRWSGWAPPWPRPPTRGSAGPGRSRHTVVPPTVGVFVLIDGLAGTPAAASGGLAAAAATTLIGGVALAGSMYTMGARPPLPERGEDADPASWARRSPCTRPSCRSA